MKQVNLYEIRHYPNVNAYSKSLGRRLREYKRACKLVRYLKKKGIDAFHAKYAVNI